MSDTRALTDGPDGLDHDGLDEDGLTAAERAEIDALRAPARSVLSERVLGWVLVVGGLVGVYASAALIVEKLHKAENPNYVASCDFSVWAQCSAALGSWQGSLLGFPNPIVGLAAFPVVVTTGVLLLAGIALPRWYWRSLLAGTAVGVAFIVFAVWTSLYALSALCPYCVTVWTIMIPIAWLQVVWALQEGHVPAPAGLRRFVVGNRWTLLAVPYAVLLVWIFAVLGDVIVASYS